MLTNPPNNILINYIVTSSNLYGILPIHYSRGYYRLWMISIVISSILMHASETKHNLPGIYPFNKYSQQFLWLDRIMAISPIIYLLVQYILYKKSPLVYLSSPKFIIGLICLFLSENFHLHSKINPYFFAFTHSLWHFCAYHTCYLFLINL